MPLIRGAPPTQGATTGTGWLDSCGRGVFPPGDGIAAPGAGMPQGGTR